MSVFSARLAMVVGHTQPDGIVWVHRFTSWAIRFVAVHPMGKDLARGWAMGHRTVLSRLTVGQVAQDILHNATVRSVASGDFVTVFRNFLMPLLATIGMEQQS